jgi:hypothetical protein
LAAPFGNSELQMRICIAEQAGQNLVPVLGGSFSVASANGSIHGRLTGGEDAVSEGVFFIVGDVTGGSGMFAGATGSFEVDQRHAEDFIIISGIVSVPT